MNKKKAVIFFAALAVCGVGVTAWYFQEDAMSLVAPSTQTDITPVLQRDQVAYTGNHWFDEVHASNVVDTRTVINGIKVPPIPDAKINNATIAGVDSDNDGVRDDMNRYIAEQFGGSSKDYQIAMSNAKALQSMLVSPTAENISVYKRASDCMVSGMLDRLDKMDRKALSTSQRGGVYGKSLAGTLISGNYNNCPNRAEIQASYLK